MGGATAKKVPKAAQAQAAAVAKGWKPAAAAAGGRCRAAPRPCPRSLAHLLSRPSCPPQPRAAWLRLLLGARAERRRLGACDGRPLSALGLNVGLECLGLNARCRAGAVGLALLNDVLRPPGSREEGL